MEKTARYITTIAGRCALIYVQQIQQLQLVASVITGFGNCQTSVQGQARRIAIAAREH